ncbi:MAG: hypothetical protein NVS2B3_18660 [Vulcanimicrobiaceae bacterium]
MDDPAFDAPTQALREAAIRLASRIRIALPYRRASPADLGAVATHLDGLRAAGLTEGDDAVTELRGLRETLEILTIGATEERARRQAD